MEKYFHIEQIDNEKLLVIILSCELTSVYWENLLEAFREKNLCDRTVYFDFLYRNGYNNRFFSAHLDNHSRLSGRLHRCDVFDRFEDISYRFFSMHEEMLNESILSAQQVKHFLGRV